MKSVSGNEASPVESKERVRMMGHSGYRPKKFISGWWLALFLILWGGAARAQRFGVLEIMPSFAVEKPVSPLAKAIAMVPPRLPNGLLPPSLISLGGSRTIILHTDDNGQSVGASYLSGDAEFHAILFNSDGICDLGTLGGDYSIARFISSSGVILGESTIAGNKERRAFLYQNGQMYDLNSFIVTPGWIIEEVLQLENNGRIMVYGRSGGKQGVAILQPIENVSPRSGILGALALGTGAAFLSKEVFKNPGGLLFDTRNIPFLQTLPGSDGDSLSKIPPHSNVNEIPPGGRNPDLITVPEPGVFAFAGIFIGALILARICRQVCGLRRPMQ